MKAWVIRSFMFFCLSFQLRAEENAEGGDKDIPEALEPDIFEWYDCNENGGCMLETIGGEYEKLSPLAGTDLEIKEMIWLEITTKSAWKECADVENEENWMMDYFKECENLDASHQIEHACNLYKMGILTGEGEINQDLVANFKEWEEESIDYIEECVAWKSDLNYLIDTFELHDIYDLSLDYDNYDEGDIMELLEPVKSRVRRSAKQSKKSKKTRRTRRKNGKKTRKGRKARKNNRSRINRNKRINKKAEKVKNFQSKRKSGKQMKKNKNITVRMSGSEKLKEIGLMSMPDIETLNIATCIREARDELLQECVNHVLSKMSSTFDVFLPGWGPVADVQPEEVKPAETKPEEVKPTETKPEEVKPAVAL